MEYVGDDDDDEQTPAEEQAANSRLRNARAG